MKRLDEDPLSVKGNSDIYPVEEAKDVISGIVRDAPAMMEANAILFGDNEDYLNKVAVPRVIGICETESSSQPQSLTGRSWNTSVRKALLDDLIGSPFHRTSIYLAAREDTHEVGIQIISEIPEKYSGFNNLKYNFIPENQLILLKDLVDYLPEEERAKFQDKSIPLVDQILQQENTANHLDVVIRFNTPLEVGQIGTDHSAIPLNGELARILKMNKVDQGTLIGITHPHAVRTEQEIADNPILKELVEHVDEHEKFITTADAEYVLNLPKFAQDLLGRDDIIIEVATIGVLLHDPVTRHFIGEYYLDLNELYNSEDWDHFVELSAIGQATGEIESLKEFYRLVRAYTVEGRPSIATPNGGHLES